MDSDGPGGKGHNGSIVQLWDCNSNIWQRWVYTGDGHIKSRYDGRCLDADGSGARDRNGADIQTWDCNGNAWQKWTFSADGKIHSQYNGRCLDADRNGTHAQQGALLQLWNCNSNSWQVWPNSLFRLGAGQSLGADEALTNGDYMLVMQSDGNLVIYGPGHVAQWATGTHASGSDLEMQGDGNLVVYDAGHVAQWATGTAGSGTTLDMQSDGNLVVYDSSRAALWASRAGAPSGDAKALAQQILNNAGIDKNRDVLLDLQDTAAGKAATAGAPLSATLLRLIFTLGQHHTFKITALESNDTGHSVNSLHYTGDAVDFGMLDGHLLTGRDAWSMTIINELKGQLPSGSAFGQIYYEHLDVSHKDVNHKTVRDSCGPNVAVLPTGISQFSDTCDHLHMQVPRGYK